MEQTKTALKKAIEALEEFKQMCTSDDEMAVAAKVVVSCKNIASKFLPTEQQQIEQAYIVGVQGGIILSTNRQSDFDSATDYFNSKYGGDGK